jgi:hypothetical protein
MKQILELKQRIAVAVAKLKEWAAECTECDGTGVTNKLKDPAWPHLGHNQVPCEECLDIREAIEDLEMPL